MTYLVYHKRCSSSYIFFYLSSPPTHPNSFLFLTFTRFHKRSNMNWDFEEYFVMNKRNSRWGNLGGWDIWGNRETGRERRSFKVQLYRMAIWSLWPPVIECVVLHRDFFIFFTHYVVFGLLVVSESVFFFTSHPHSLRFTYSVTSPRAMWWIHHLN